MQATFSERRGHEVYVYVRGRLVSKVWLCDEQAERVAVFHIAPSGTVWFYREHMSDRAW